MSLPQFGYPITSTGGTMSQTALTPGSSPKNSRSSPCCENGRPIMTNPLNGQTICSCQYNPATAAALYNYPRVPGLPEALYSSAVAAQAQGLLPFAAAADPTALYAGLAPGYDFKGISSPAGLAYPFDPSLTAYPYGNGFLDPNARRKNATRESTATLKAWLSEHKKNPYPTKGEKIMLAIITKMTLTQVSTWFANARRRLKKDHKMTWEPRNRMDDDDRDTGSDIEDDRDHDDINPEDENISVDSDDEDSMNQLRHIQKEVTSTDVSRIPGERSENETDRSATIDSNANKSQITAARKDSESNEDTLGSPKPKIWSMAEIATSNKNEHVRNTDNLSSLSQHSSHQNKLPSAHAQMLHPAWRGAHPYFQAHMLQSRLAALSQAHPVARLPTNPFSTAVVTSQLRAEPRTAASAFVPIANLTKTSTS